MQPRQSGLPNLPLGAVYALAVVCAMGVVAVAYYCAQVPLSHWHSDIARRSDLVQAKLAGGPELRRQHAERSDELARLLVRVEEVNRRIPDQPREGEFLAELSRLAEVQGVRIENFSRGNTTDSATHSAVDVVVTAVGSHAGLCGLLDEVSRLPRIIELTSLEVDQPASGSGDYPIRLNYSLYYAMAAPAPATPADL